jgi:hypothetical protein
MSGDADNMYFAKINFSLKARVRAIRTTIKSKIVVRSE